MESNKNTGLSWGVMIFQEKERAGDEEISERPGGLMFCWRSVDVGASSPSFLFTGNGARKLVDGTVMMV
jgi:hypothetical protein